MSVLDEEGNPSDPSSTQSGTLVTLLLVVTNATVLFCSSAAARKAFVESSQYLLAALLLGILVLVVLGVPVGRFCASVLVNKLMVLSSIARSFVASVGKIVRCRKKERSILYSTSAAADVTRSSPLVLS